MNQSIILLSLLALLLIPTGAMALVMSADLNNFSQDGAVWTTSSGHQAIMFGQSELVNNPWEGDSGIEVSENVLSLSFSYLFLEPNQQDTSFSALLYDSEGLTIGEFEASNTSSGEVTWDLAGLFSTPTLLGLDFYLTSESGEKNLALALIDNPRFVFADYVPNNGSDNGMNNGSNNGIVDNGSGNAPAPAPVPEPTTMLLLGAGLLGLAGFSRKKFLK